MSSSPTLGTCLLTRPAAGGILWCWEVARDGDEALLVTSLVLPPAFAILRWVLSLGRSEWRHPLPSRHVSRGTSCPWILVLGRGFYWLVGPEWPGVSKHWWRLRCFGAAAPADSLQTGLGCSAVSLLFPAPVGSPGTLLAQYSSFWWDRAL